MGEMRPIMNAGELESHRTHAHGRDYSRSDCGYDDMELAACEGWHAIAAWGNDGWDLGDWPYVVISHRTVGRKVNPYEIRQTVEGDTTVYAFQCAEDRNAALDYLFLWYIAGRDILPLRIDRGALDAGTFEDKWPVPAAYRGPYSHTRVSL